MKKVSKIVMIMMMLMLILSITTSVLAVTGTDVTPEQMDGTSNADVGGITSIGNSIIRILSTGGIVVSVVVLIVLGIKYMMGSAEEKAEYKKTLMPYVIGAALVFAASTIAQIVYNFMQQV